MTPTVTSLCPEGLSPAVIHQALGGDHQAFRLLVNAYTPMVYNHIYRLCQNPSLADELTQEVFIKVYKKGHTFHQARSFKPWLLRIAFNATISVLRKPSKVLSLEAMLDSQGDALLNQIDQPSEKNPAEVLENRLSAAEVFNALSQLDVKYRQVLLLRYQEDLRYEEIAEALQLNLNTVRTWLKRGRELLKKQLATQEKEKNV